MFIPCKIIDAFSHFPPAAQGEAIIAVIRYIKSESEPEAGSISETAMGLFLLAKEILAPRMRRRKQNKCADKIRPTACATTVDKPASDVTPVAAARPDNEKAPAYQPGNNVMTYGGSLPYTAFDSFNNYRKTPMLSRAERRRLKRNMEKLRIST